MCDGHRPNTEFCSLFHCYDFSWSQGKEDEGGNKDEEQPEAADRKEQNTNGQTGEENIQSDTAVELAGEASERDQAKEVLLYFNSALHLFHFYYFR